VLRYLPGPEARMDRLGNDWRRGLTAGLNILGLFRRESKRQRMQKEDNTKEIGALHNYFIARLM